MVIGGGIAGMQSALDLADSGYFVHLVEKSPAIGGVMSELDKNLRVQLGLVKSEPTQDKSKPAEGK